MKDRIVLTFTFADRLAADITLLYDTAPQNVFQGRQLLQYQAALLDKLVQIRRVRFHIRHVTSRVGYCQEKNTLKMNANDLMP
jgi:hypothetical protein